jgi:hypothetical protein
MRGSEAISGAQAGLLSGTFVAMFFFVGDLIQLAPLSTPLALMQELSLQEMPQDGISAGLDLAAMFEVASWFSLGGGLLALTTLHLLAFALLAVAAVAFFDLYQLPLNTATGAVWGLVVYSLVFELSMAIASPGLVAGVPGFWSIAGVNLFAGAIMGGYVQLKTRAGGSRRA